MEGMAEHCHSHIADHSSFHNLGKDNRQVSTLVGGLPRVHSHNGESRTDGRFRTTYGTHPLESDRDTVTLVAMYHQATIHA